jgi:hypothetical protein
MGFQLSWERKKRSPVPRDILVENENLSWLNFKLV